MRNLTHTLTIMGVVKSVDPSHSFFTIECRSGDLFKAFVSETTNYTVLQNLDNLNRDRVLDPEGDFEGQVSNSLKKVRKYIWPDGLIAINGIQYIFNGQERFEASNIYLLHSTHGRYLFEDTHWWLTQIQVMANEWLDSLFGDKRTYLQDDFVGLYRTNLNIIGLPTDDNIQEMATLSRYVYGLSSAYLLTGSDRYLEAAKAGIKFQRDAFRILTHDNNYCFWAFGRRKLKYGSEIIEYSLNGDDLNTMPLYEQIYALAGLTQYYRVTCDAEVLEDIIRTVKMFNAFYLDSKTVNPDFPGLGGYFSHIDYVTRRPDEKALNDNMLRKNWNSIGDHIPAYLINLILALDPLPLGRQDQSIIQEFVDMCKKMLRETSELILRKFPDADPKIPFVNERYYADWTVDDKWRWQQDRAIVGHNLKIAWNLTRVANYYKSKDQDPAFAAELMVLANNLGKAMGKIGVDQIRGGCFDAVERKPINGNPLQFVWGNTKDFWQQEQGILAYLILHGNAENQEDKDIYLALAREMTAFWNLFFLDHDNRGIYFRVTDDGLPVLNGAYANKSSHSIAGYHSFELNFLAHTYIRSYVKTPDESDKNFVLYFKPDLNCQSVNVLPDFFPPDHIEIKSIKINGVIRHPISKDYFQVDLADNERGARIAVEFNPKSI